MTTADEAAEPVRTFTKAELAALLGKYGKRYSAELNAGLAPVLKAQLDAAWKEGEQAGLAAGYHDAANLVEERLNGIEAGDDPFGPAATVVLGELLNELCRWHKDAQHRRDHDDVEA